jgi:phosphoglucosamine mutase
MARSRRSLSALAGVVKRLPQVLRSVRVADSARLEAAPALRDVLRAVEADLGADGRVLVRPSGTEPVVRVMVEAPTTEVANAAADRLAAAVEDAGGAPGPGA